MRSVNSHRVFFLKIRFLIEHSDLQVLISVSLTVTVPAMFTRTSR